MKKLKKSKSQKKIKREITLFLDWVLSKNDFSTLKFVWRVIDSRKKEKFKTKLVEVNRPNIRFLKGFRAILRKFAFHMLYIRNYFAIKIIFEREIQLQFRKVLKFEQFVYVYIEQFFLIFCQKNFLFFYRNNLFPSKFLFVGEALKVGLFS
jgi:hypothetical protein